MIIVVTKANFLSLCSFVEFLSHYLRIHHTMLR